MLLCYPRVEDLHCEALVTVAQNAHSLIVCAYFPTASLMIFCSIHVLMLCILVLAAVVTPKSI